MSLSVPSFLDCTYVPRHTRKHPFLLCFLDMRLLPARLQCSCKRFTMLLFSFEWVPDLTFPHIVPPGYTKLSLHVCFWRIIHAPIYPLVRSTLTINNSGLRAFPVHTTPCSLCLRVFLLPSSPPPLEPPSTSVSPSSSLSRYNIVCLRHHYNVSI